MGGVLQQGRIAQSPRWQCCGGPNPVAQRACQSRSSESGRCTGRRCIIIMMPWNVSPDTVMHSASAPCAPRCAAGGAQYQRRVARRARRALVQVLRRRSAPPGFAQEWLCGPLSLQVLRVSGWPADTICRASQRRSCCLHGGKGSSGTQAVQATDADLAGRRRCRVLTLTCCREHQERKQRVSGVHLVITAEDERASGVRLLGDG